MQDKLKSIIDYGNTKEGKQIQLAMLYFGEGTKNRKRGCLTIGNSDPQLIKHFLHLLRTCYMLDESKFRCTVQCRADQNSDLLTIFWSEQTNIPLTQFYKTQVDKRTIGKPTKKLNYKGVCRIDYFNSNIFHEMISCYQILSQGPVA
ncbi:MAG: hypothetical protein ABIH21_01835 [Patescibacteria group bacterium]